MMKENNPANVLDILISGEIGTQQFCRDCEIYDTCDHKKQKVMWCSMQAIEYYNRNQFTSDYVFPGGYMDQPVWLYELSCIVSETMSSIKKDK